MFRDRPRPRRRCGSRWARSGPATVGVVLGLAAVAAATDGAAATASPSASRAAAVWAAGQLTGGTHVQGEFGADIGLTADVVLALAAAGVGRPVAAAGGRWLASRSRSYLTGGVPGDVSAGSAAKLILVARALGRNPSTFGPLNLTATLRGRLGPNGRFTDSLDFGGPKPVDQSTTFTQSLAILSLRPAVPPRAVSFLVSKRCRDGGFPVFYPEPGQPCVSDADGTGLAVQALLAVGAGRPAAPAVRWLVRHQRPDGSFSNSGPGAAPNSNSTALAVQALRAAGRPAAAGRGVSWLLSRQLGCSAAAGDRGAVGYLDPVLDGSALRATAQAVPALAGLSLGDLDGRAARASAGLPAMTCSPAPTPTPTPTSTQTSTSTSTSTRSPTPVPTRSRSGRSTLTRTSAAVPLHRDRDGSAPAPAAVFGSQPVSASGSTPTAAGLRGLSVLPAAAQPPPAVLASEPIWQRIPAGWGLGAGAVAVAGWLGLMLGQRRPRTAQAVR